VETELEGAEGADQHQQQKVRRDIAQSERHGGDVGIMVAGLFATSTYAHDM